LNFLDWLVIITYLALVIGIALYITRSQKNTEDYYLGGRKIKWWQSGASTMATQLGAVSFVSAPAFVAIKDGGGLKWLCYEFGVPLALIPVMAVIIPVLHRHHYLSIYEYLEKRFDSGTRNLISALFQLGRGLATAVAVLAGGLVLSTALSVSTPTAILLVGAITVIYDAIGGIRVVILSDFLQMVIIITGILICGGVAIYLTGWESGLASLASQRYEIFDFKRWGFTTEGTYAFWPMLIGGFFLYISYYGTDQSQVQRELSVGNVDDVRKSLLVNALGRFPLVLAYCFMGVFIGAIFTQPHTIMRVAQALGMGAGPVSDILKNDPDRMVPMFILSFLPHGVIGFIFVAIMAALMSSLDSGLNSLSAVTMNDFYQKYLKTDAHEKHYLIASKVITFLWGVFCVSAALAFYNFGEATRHTTIVLINAVGSMLYGPILAAFTLGMFTTRIGPRSIKTGIISGIIVNLFLWIFSDVSWLWWNFTGFLSAILVSYISNIIIGRTSHDIPHTTLIRHVEEPSSLTWKRIYGGIALYFGLILLLTYLIEWWGTG
jgi:sodium-dependent multivitamin transporter 6